MTSQGNFIGGVTVTAAIASRLRDDIRAGRFAPGEPLRQTTIAREFEVSTTPVREAFMVLEREGLVTRLDRRGVMVFNPTIEDLREIFRIRISLETLATEAAVLSLTEKEIEALEDLVYAERQAHVDNRIETAVLLGEAFHAAIYKASRLPRLIALIENLVAASLSYVTLTGVAGSTRLEIDSAHQAILAACKDRDPARAAAEMRVHLTAALDLLAAVLAARSATDDPR